MATTTELQHWYDLEKGLRDTSLWTVPHFETRRIVLAVEDGFEQYEAHAS